MQYPTAKRARYIPYNLASRIDASEDFLEPGQPQSSIRLNCGEFAFFAPSGWFGCLSFALARIRRLPDYAVARMLIQIIPVL